MRCDGHGAAGPVTGISPPWRGAGVVERGGLENRCGRKSTEGSNPSLSAIPPPSSSYAQIGFATPCVIACH